MGGEALLAVARLTTVLDQIKAVEIDARDDMRGGWGAGGSARGRGNFFSFPFARKRREFAVLLKQCRCVEMVSHR
jgi:hypothetical protein